jgi:DNA-binding IclR family transcriptional regulator
VSVSEGNGDDLDPGDLNQSVMRAERILSCFSREEPSLGVLDVASKTGLPKSATHRLLRTLSHVGLLTQDAKSRKYSIGQRAYEIGSLYLAVSGLASTIQAELALFAEECEHTVYYGTVTGNDAVLLYVDHGSSPVRVVGDPGTRFPAHATALGKAILSFWPRDRQQQYIEWAESFVDKWPLPDRFPAELADVNERGYAVSFEETYAGVCAVAAAVVDDGAPVGAIAASVPVQEFSPERAEELGEMSKKRADNVARRAGYRA